MKNKSLIKSFNNAFNGIKYTLKNERNMKFHLMAFLIVLLASLIFKISKIEFLVVLIVSAIVITVEILNTAVEQLVNVLIKVYHPKAKIIKDVSAGAVLISSVFAIIVGYLIFFQRLELGLNFTTNQIKKYPPHIVLIVLIATITLVLIIKSITQKGTPFQGGIPSGHSAVAFAVGTAVALWTSNFTIAVLCFFLAFLVAQSRVEGKIHTLYEAVIGSIVGILITIFIYKLLNN